MIECENLLQPAIMGVLDDLSITWDDTGCKLILPIQRSDGDYITLWVSEREKGWYEITDEGETHEMLYLSGMNLDTESKQRRLESIKHQFDLDEIGNEIRLRCEEDDLGHRIFQAFQAVLSISYLTYTRREYPQSKFIDENDY